MVERRTVCGREKAVVVVERRAVCGLFNVEGASAPKWVRDSLLLSRSPRGEGRGDRTASGGNGLLGGQCGRAVFGSRVQCAEAFGNDNGSMPNSKDALTLQFVDPVTMTTTGHGFPVKDYAVKECAPALSVGLGALTMLSEASANRERRFGLPIAKAEDERAVLHEAYTKVKASLAQSSLTHVTMVNDEARRRVCAG